MLYPLSQNPDLGTFLTGINGGVNVMCGFVSFTLIEVGKVKVSFPLFFALEKLYKDDHAKGEQQDEQFKRHL